MNLLERNVVGKRLDQSLCEDVVVITPTHVAVIDGATDQTGIAFTYEGKQITGGRFAGLVLGETVKRLQGGETPREIVDQLSFDLDQAIIETTGPLSNINRPSASIVIYDDTTGVITSVGDCHVRVNDHVDQPVKLVDYVTRTFRAMVLEAHAQNDGVGLASDNTQTSNGDVGRDAINPLLRVQGALANTPGEFSYGLINGTNVPDRHIRTLTGQLGDNEIVLATDGYTYVGGTLAEAEAILQAELAGDPQCITILRGTGGREVGANSFDDRAWVRFTTKRRPTVLTTKNHTPLPYQVQPLHVPLVENQPHSSELTKTANEFAQRLDYNNQQLMINGSFAGQLTVEVGLYSMLLARREAFKAARETLHLEDNLLLGGAGAHTAVLTCDGWVVLARRGVFGYGVNAGKIVGAVGEMAELEDVVNGLWDPKKTLLRGLEEEMGVAEKDVKPAYTTSYLLENGDVVASFCTTTSLTADELLAQCETASDNIEAASYILWRQETLGQELARDHNWGVWGPPAVVAAASFLGLDAHVPGKLWAQTRPE